MEKLLYSIGEVVAVCIDYVAEVRYPSSNNFAKFIIRTDDGREYVVELKEKQSLRHFDKAI